MCLRVYLQFDQGGCPSKKFIVVKDDHRCHSESTQFDVLFRVWTIRISLVDFDLD